jgi:saccharopine dehydrogenase-like NADP-dependent oxidoreductase
MIQIGDKKGFSAMSVTVGTPTAIGAQMILDNKISERGVLIPIFEDIYNPVLKTL